eukprot:gene23822-biopygen22340
MLRLLRSSRTVDKTSMVGSSVRALLFLDRAGARGVREVPVVPPFPHAWPDIACPCPSRAHALPPRCHSGGG